MTLSRISRPRWAMLFLAIGASGCATLTPYEQARSELGTGRFLGLERGAVYVEDRGEGEAVVLVHGFGASSFSWRHVTEGLVAAGYRTLAVDLYGFGLSARPQTKLPYSRFHQGQLILDLLDELDIERAHLVGHSYGGAVSMALAARASERFESLMLIGSAAPDYPQRRRTIAAAARPVTALFVRLRLTPNRIRRSLRRSAADDSIVTPELVDGYYRRLAIEGAPRAFWGLTAPMADRQGEIELSEIEMPTLVIWGVEDRLIAVEGARRAAAEVPDSRFVTLEGIGHLPMEESPEALSVLMLRFLDGGLFAFDSNRG